MDDTPKAPRILAEHGLEGVYEEMLPHWRKYEAGEITLEQYKELWRSCWARYLAAQRPTESKTWTP